MAGVSRLQYPPDIRLIRVMCSGRVDMGFVLKAFYNGADGVFVGGCRLGECNYTTHGNYYAWNMVALCRRIMEYAGINSERLKIEFMSSAEGIRFARIITEFIKQIREIGPIGEGEGISKEELRKKLQDIIRLVPYIKVAKKEKLAIRPESEEALEKLYTKEEIEELFSQVPSYYIDPEKCQACGTCRRRCPAGAISGEKNKIHVIDQDKCIKCGTCYEVCPPKFKAVKKLVNEPVPPPIPEEERTVKRKKATA